jgi:hypothetical protein
VVPPDEGLHRDDASAAQVLLHLVDHAELPGLEPGPQVGEQLETVDAVDVQGGEEGADPVPLELGVVQRDVGVLHQRLGAGAVLGGDRHAGARPHEQLQAAHAHGGLQRRQQGAGDLLGLGQVAVDHDGELVTTQPVRADVVVQRGPQACGDLPQQDVAHRVAQRVVDRLEVVEVQEHQAGTGCRRLAQVRAQQPVQPLPVAQAREGVVRRLVRVAGGCRRGRVDGDDGRPQQREHRDPVLGDRGGDGADAQQHQVGGEDEASVVPQDRAKRVPGRQGHHHGDEEPVDHDHRGAGDQQGAEVTGLDGDRVGEERDPGDRAEDRACDHDADHVLRGVEGGLDQRAPVHDVVAEARDGLHDDGHAEAAHRHERQDERSRGGDRLGGLVTAGDGHRPDLPDHGRDHQEADRPRLGPGERRPSCRPQGEDETGRAEAPDQPQVGVQTPRPGRATHGSLVGHGLTRSTCARRPPGRRRQPWSWSWR